MFELLMLYSPIGITERTSILPVCLYDVFDSVKII